MTNGIIRRGKQLPEVSRTAIGWVAIESRTCMSCHKSSVKEIDWLYPASFSKKVCLFMVLKFLSNSNTDGTDYTDLHGFIFYPCASASSVESVFHHNITLNR